MSDSREGEMAEEGLGGGGTASLPTVEEAGDGKKKTGGGCASRCNVFDGYVEAKGYNLLQVARSTVVISNIFLSTALIRLASDAAGCGDTRGADCDKTIYGFRPSSLVTTIYTISGLMSAFFLPWIGAVVDCTPHRKRTGVVSAMLLVCIQTAQIFTLPATWFPMAILQAVAGFVFMVQIVVVVAYLPDLGKLVGEKLMERFTSVFYGSGFGAQVGFLLIVVVLQMALQWEDIFTAQISQAINAVIILILFTWGWKCMPNVPPSRQLAEGQSLLVQGFKQTFRTTKGINKHYGGSLRWYFLAVMFADAGANGLIAVEVPFMVEVLDFSSSKVGMVNLVILICAVPGSMFGGFVARRTNPKLNYILCNVYFAVITLASGFVLTSPERGNLAYIWGVLWGVALGWFWPGELLIFSLAVPKGQDSELSGFYSYVGQILSWLPALLFTLMNEAGIGMQYGLMMVAGFFVLGVLSMALMSSWDRVLDDAAQTNRMVTVVESESSVEDAEATDDVEVS